MTDDGRGAVFAGIGVGAYDDPDFSPLPLAVPGMQQIAALLAAHGCEARLMSADPTEQQVREQLAERLPNGGLDGDFCLVLLWAGHGELTPEGAVQLIARDTTRTAMPWLDASKLAGVAARSGARQILLVLDTCYSGDAGMPLLDVLTRVLGELTASERTTWAGVLTSTLPLERARDGLFGRRLVELLTSGPANPLLQRRWSPHDEFIRLEDVADALAQEWTEDCQAPTFQRHGTGRELFPNPLFDANAPAEIVEHLLLAARGADPGEERSFFTGRVEPIDDLVTWLGRGEPGVYVVTGPAGSGKSAIVGRIVSLSDPDERRRILAAGALEHMDPHEGTIHAHVHARGLTAENVVEQLDRCLVRAGVLARHDGGSRNRGELLGALERADVLPVIVVDGLDEAGSEAVLIAEDVVRLLRPYARFVIGTRDVGEPSLVEALTPDAEVDLGDERLAAQTSDDAVAYVVKRLSGHSDETMDAAAVGRALADSAAASDEGVFLLAHIVTAQLREAPIDTSESGWRERLATAVGTAFYGDLDDIPSLVREGVGVPAAAELLEALAWSYGAGMPDDVWAVAASALSRTGTEYDRDDVLWLLQHAGRYVVESGEAGQAVYRLVHQRLVELFLPDRRIDHIEARGAQLALRLTDHYMGRLRAGAELEEPSYLQRHLWRHATDGGGRGLVAFGMLAVEVAPGMDAMLAAALSGLSFRYSEIGRHNEALSPALQAVEIHRELAERWPKLRSELAMALGNLGTRYSAVGRRTEALVPSEEAVTIYRDLADESAAVIPHLAGMLNNLGIRYGEVGRRTEALVPSEEAVTIYRDLAKENPAFLPDLAMALNNLANRQSELHRFEDAIPLAEEATRLRRALARENAAVLPDLAGSLSNLGVMYSEVERVDDALEPTQQAVAIYRELAADNPGYLPNLAISINNLAVRESQLRRFDASLAPSEEAVRLYRALAAENRAFLPSLAMTLTNLGVAYADVDRDDEALAPSEEAVAIYRKLTDESAANLPQLASAIHNLAARYVEAGQVEEATAALKETFQLRCALLAEDSSFLSETARALHNLEHILAAYERSEELEETWDAILAALPDPEIRRLLVQLRERSPSN